MVANKFSGMTFIISKDSKNIAEIVEKFQKEKLDVQVLSVYSKVLSAAYFTVGSTSVSPTKLFQVLSVFTGLPNCSDPAELTETCGLGHFSLSKWVQAWCSTDSVLSTLLWVRLSSITFFT